jgi:putative endonuclease
MWFSKKLGEKVVASQVTTKAAGDAAESIALEHLRASGLKLLETNYRTPGRGGGEIDLIMKDLNGTLVFIEVRQRASQSHGGAGASITAVKQRRIVFAAQYYLMRFKTLPPCRFDVVLVHGGLAAGDTPVIEWLRSAFDAG